MTSNNQNLISGAIEYPNQERQSNQDEQQPNQPRQPRNMQDLLRYSTEAAHGNFSPNFRPMDPESRRFLENALSKMSVDVVAELKKNLDVIKQSMKDGQVEECVSALENTRDLIECIDFANDFHKIGGFEIFSKCFESNSQEIRSESCHLLAELCQNNPYCQKEAIEWNFLPILLKLTDKDSEASVRIKSLHACSCLVRDFEPALKQFISLDGFSVLLRAMQADIEKLSTKSAFLLSSLSSKYPWIKDCLIEMGFLEQLIGLIGGLFDSETLEHVLSALDAILNGNRKAQEICRNPQFQLRSVLASVKDYYAGKPEAQEILEYTENIERHISEELLSGEDR